MGGKVLDRQNNPPPRSLTRCLSPRPVRPHSIPRVEEDTYTVKLDSRETPPPLHFSPAISNSDRSSTAETTPIGTPRGFGPVGALPRKAEKEKENLFSWGHRNYGFGGSNSSYVDSSLPESDLEDVTVPLFNEPSGQLGMGSRTTPIDIAAPSQQHGSRNQSSMASALRGTSGNEARPSTGMSIGSGYRFSHRDSVSAAQPILMQNASNHHNRRRESLAGSMVTGMSWGGASVSSWIRDDIIMQGTSPFAYQSPSFHSSSYQPKLEADFMRDFSCCGLTLPTLHDLLEHYEENHHQHVEELQKRALNEGPPPDPKAAIASNAAAALKDPTQAQQQQPARPNPHPSTPQRSNTPIPAQRTPKQPPQGFTSLPTPTSQEEEAAGNMEMDEDFASQPAMAQQYRMQGQSRMIQRNQFGQPANRAPPLDLTVVNRSNALLQHQGLRHSTPTTPVSAGRSGTFYQNNPTVSSVNTPTLSAHPGAHSLQQKFYTPESSAPGTPGELDPELVGNVGQMDVGGSMPFMPQNNGYSNWSFTPNSEMPDLCIDEPAKRLYAANGVFNANMRQQQQQQHGSGCTATQLGDGQYSENSEIARTIREQQKLAGVPDPSADGVSKPFHCPVIGCEKAYKNQNGLKYHKSHGHNTQTLHANSNGTFSIVDPDTLKPFPGTLGMEKHKPYQCHSCGKRYKNLNGLKYHKVHSSTCDPEIRGLPSAATSKRNSLEIQASHIRDEGGSFPTTHDEMVMG
ncbi:MAG: hypothetical protein Q9163_005682 [Psora crenata]